MNKKIVLILFVLLLGFYITLNHRLKSTTHDVVFLSHDDRVLATQEVKNGLDATPPRAPFLEGYVFVGWDQDYFNIKEDLTLNPIYEAVDYHLNFNTSGGVRLSAITFNYQENFNLSELAPTKEGYIFEGWYYDASLTSKVGSHLTLPAENMTLYAKWIDVDDDLEYEVIDNTVHIIKYNGLNETFIIPETINGYQVSTIKEGAFKDHPTLKHLTIPKFVSAIEDEAFYHAKALSTITFNDASALNHFGKDLFIGTPYLENALDQLIINHHLVYVKNTQEATIVLNDDVQVITPHAFKDTIYMNTLIVNEGLTEIKTRAFKNHPGLQTILFNEESTLNSIGEEAFYGISINHLTLPKSLESIGDYAFKDSSIKSLTFNEESSINYFGIGVFMGSQIESVEWPQSLNTIKEKTFYDAKALKDFSIPDHIEIIEEEAFKGSGIRDLIIPETVLIIESHAFSYGVSLKTVTVLDRALPLFIESYAFSFNQALKHVRLSSYTVSFAYAFSHNPNLTMFYAPKETELGHHVLYNSMHAQVFLEGDRHDFYSNTFDHETELLIYDHVLGFIETQDLSAVILSDETLLIYALNHSINNPLPHEVTGYEVSTLGALLFKGQVTESLTIPASIKTLNPYVFAYASIQSLTFLEGSMIKTIPHHAFYETDDLIEVVLPKSIESIHPFAFSNTSDLSSVNFENGSLLTHIEAFAFSNNHSLQNVTLDSLTSLEFVGAYAFSSNHALKELYIPESLLHIEFFAFFNTPNLILYTTLLEPYNTWDNAFNPDYNPVYYGIIKEETK